jgi:SPP1 family predicted phage head-tail adaptor
MSVLDGSIAARLRQRVTLQQASESPDGAGGFARSWNDVAALWAELTPLQGREQLDAMQLASRVTHRAVLRYRDDVSADKRLILADGRIFNIRAVLNIAEQSYLLELLVEENAAT